MQPIIIKRTVSGQVLIEGVVWRWALYAQLLHGSGDDSSGLVRVGHLYIILWRRWVVYEKIMVVIAISKISARHVDKLVILYSGTPGLYKDTPEMNQ